MRVIICKPFFFFVFRTQKGGRAPSCSLQRLWKLVIRIVTTFIVCKWDLWWACGLFSVMIEVKHVVDHVLACSCFTLYKYLRYQWFNLQLLEATSTTRVTLICMCLGCVYKGSFVLDCCALCFSANGNYLSTNWTSLFIFEVL